MKRHKLIHWVHKEGVDELYDLQRDPYEMKNLINEPSCQEVKKNLVMELRKLVAESVGL
jgi:hypothetical protein